MSRQEKLYHEFINLQFDFSVFILHLLQDDIFLFNIERDQNFRSF